MNLQASSLGTAQLLSIDLRYKTGFYKVLG